MAIWSNPVCCSDCVSVCIPYPQRWTLLWLKLLLQAVYSKMLSERRGQLFSPAALLSSCSTYRYILAMNEVFEVFPTVKPDFSPTVSALKLTRIFARFCLSQLGNHNASIQQMSDITCVLTDLSIYSFGSNCLGH